MLVCATRWLYVHLYTLTYMSMHESCLLVCHPYFNTMKLWTPDPNLHLSLADATFVCFLSCLPFCLFVCFLAYLPSRLFARILISMLAMSITFVHFMPLPYAFCTFFFSLLVCWFIVFGFACTHMQRGRMELGHSFPGASKKGKDASMWIWAKQLQSVGLGFSFSLWLCTLLNPFLPPPFLP